MASPLPIPEPELSREDICALAEVFALLLEWDAEERAIQPARSHDETSPDCD